MKAIVTVAGQDQVGITATVCVALAENQVNILDISQTVMKEYFTMTMLVDLTACTETLGVLGEKLDAVGATKNLSIRIQRTDIFDAMHRI